MRKTQQNPSCTTPVNDVHAKLNWTQVARENTVHCAEEVARVLKRAHRLERCVIAAGGRHAMGGQQFATHGELIDTRGMNKILSFDQASGRIRVEAGIIWPDLMRGYLALQKNVPAEDQWGIRQKQTGADKLTLGGALAANIHGRCLSSAPFSQDVLNMRVMLASGEIVLCSRTDNAQLFSLVIGGYGLFGVILDLTLQLVPRECVQRRVSTSSTVQLPKQFSRAKVDGALYGDFQFDIDPASEGFLQRGIFSCYYPVAAPEALPKNQRRLTQTQWQELLHLAHVDKSAAYDRFSEFYLASNNQLYWSDTHQLNIYLDDYHRKLDLQLGSKCRGSEMITELYVPMEKLERFLEDCRVLLRERQADLVYGTIRISERDNDAFLPWAKQATACVIFNLHVDHQAEQMRTVAKTFEMLIDLAIKHQGSFYLTYHSWVRTDQLLSCYPQLPEFLEYKQRYDPRLRFRSDWFNRLRSKLTPQAYAF